MSKNKAKAKRAKWGGKPPKFELPGRAMPKAPPVFTAGVVGGLLGANKKKAAAGFLGVSFAAGKFRGRRRRWGKAVRMGQDRKGYDPFRS